MLGRSRSLRMLRGGRKETHQQDGGKPAPLPSFPQIGFDRLKAATPVVTTDRRIETPDMIERPKTSNGAGERSKQFHRKVAPANLSSEDQTWKFPFPSSNHSSATILYTAEVHEDTEGVIGIALGSPTMNTNSTWNLSPQTTNLVPNTASTVTQVSSNATPPAPVISRQEAPKPKISRWKSIFGRKPREQKTTTFYQLAQSAAPARQDSDQDTESLDSRYFAQPTEFKGEAQAGSPPAFKADIRESREAPKGQEQPSTTARPRALTNMSNKSKTSLLRSASSPKSAPKEQRNKAPTVPQLLISGGDVEPNSNGETPLIDVCIPDIKMDRYSVMFGDLLQQPSSSLLARRPGASERLEPLNLTGKDGNDRSQNRNLKPQCRATPPSHRAKSPSGTLSLFPNPDRNRTPSPRAIANSVNRPRPLQRSKTAPAVSPSRQSFNLSELPINGVKEASQDRQSRDTKTESEDPNLKSQLFTPTPSTLRSFESSTAESPIIVSRASGVPLRPQLSEPDWEIISRPSQRTALSSHPANVPLEGPLSAPLEQPKLKLQTDDKVAPRSADRLVSPKSQVSPKPRTQKAGGLQKATTIGIARSVSVSRAVSPRSADLLKPTISRTGTERSPSRSRDRSPGSELFVDRKPLTPTLVELSNRKSQRVQLVHAEA